MNVVTPTPSVIVEGRRASKGFHSSRWERKKRIPYTDINDDFLDGHVSPTLIGYMYAPDFAPSAAWSLTRSTSCLAVSVTLLAADDILAVLGA